MLTNIVTLQRLPHLLQEHPGPAFRPPGQLHIINPLPILPNPQIQLKFIHQEPRFLTLKELRYEFLQARGVLHNIIPIPLDTLKQSIWLIEFATL